MPTSPTEKRGYHWVSRELARMDPETEWERMISLYTQYQVNEFALALMIYPVTMHVMQPSLGSATLDHTRKLELKPHRRFQDGNDFFMHWMVDGPSSEAGKQAVTRLNRMHMAIARETPHLPGNFDDNDDFIFPLVQIATFGHRLQRALGLPGLPEHMKIAWHHWSAAVFQLFERESGPVSGFPEDYDAMIAFAEEFDARPYERTDSGQRVATAMMNFWAERWFPRPLQSFGRDLTRYLAGERTCRIHGIGWITPGRERVIRLFLKTMFRAQGLAPESRTPVTEKLKKTRLTNQQLKELEPYEGSVRRAQERGDRTASTTA
ncbi:oxygenase MpaB family protein [Streptomyces sp. NBC_00457]|uniref:oxygenase MpaB family protein n=1 Tax=Streptomyces sp. NBC_00457 TaxID=2975748 RepID=UPI002E23C9B7